jgi:hypothetical protein
MAWTHIQSFVATAQYGASTNPTTGVTLGSSVAAGDTILLQTGTGGQSTTFSSTVTDQLGNTYMRLTTGQGGQLYDSTNNESQDFWYCIVTASGTPALTYTPKPGSSENFLLIQGDHFTGSDANSVRRSSNGSFQSNPGTGTNAITSGSVSAQNGDLLWAASGDPASGPTTTEVKGTGFSTGAAFNNTIGCLTEYLTASGSASGTFTDATNGGGQNYFTGAIAITPAGGGGGGVVYAAYYQQYHRKRVVE